MLRSLLPALVLLACSSLGAPTLRAQVLDALAERAASVLAGETRLTAPDGVAQDRFGFSVAEADPLDLDVIDALGRVVLRLASETSAAGTRRFQIDAGVATERFIVVR